MLNYKYEIIPALPGGITMSVENAEDVRMLFFL